MKTAIDEMLIEKQVISDQNILFTIRNTNGISVKILSYGGIITSIFTPDKNDELKNIVLGYDSPEIYSSKEYIENCPYFGAIIGRYANRISKGRFSINEKSYQLSVNNGKNHLHGGFKGFDKVTWSAKEIKTSEFVGLELAYLSKDGEEGYPGNLQTIVKYVLTNDNRLIIIYEAETDKSTPVNLTNHTYFNLTSGKSNILNHELRINAENYTGFDKSNIPTGEIKAVKGTNLDFTELKNIGKMLVDSETGYDHNFILNKTENHIAEAAELYDPNSGRKVVIRTTKPGVQIYTANFLNKNIPSGNSREFKKYDGICFETQFFPDSPNHDHFSDCILNPGEKYSHVTEFEFLVDEG